MLETVSNPIDRSAVLEQRLDPLRRGEDRYGVKDNGGSARQRHIRGQVLSRFKANTANLCATIATQLLPLRARRARSVGDHYRPPPSPARRPFVPCAEAWPCQRGKAREMAQGQLAPDRA